LHTVQQFLWQKKQANPRRVEEGIMAMSRNHTIWKVYRNFWWEGTTHQSKILLAVPTWLVDWERQENRADKRVNWIAICMQTT
jgi:hypothetical protein